MHSLGVKNPWSRVRVFVDGFPTAFENQKMAVPRPMAPITAICDVLAINGSVQRHLRRAHCKLQRARRNLRRARRKCLKTMEFISI